MINDKDIDRMYELVDNMELKVLIEKLVDERDKLLKIANIDELTMINNRRVLSNDINYDVVVMCDIDNFKGINDKYGHLVGDKILVLVSKVLDSITREEDFVCRYGGDEFTIVLRDCSIEDAIKKMTTIKDKIMCVMYELDIDVTISFGMTEYEEGKLLIDAIDEADKALYKSKLNGKNRITTFDTEKIKK